VGNENHNTSGDRGVGTYKERDGQIYPKKITLLGTSYILRKALSIK